MWQQIFPLSMFAASATNIRYDCMVLQNSDRDLISYDIQEMVQVTWWRAPMGNTTLSDRDSNLWFTFNAWLDKRTPSSNYSAHCMSHNHLQSSYMHPSGKIWNERYVIPLTRMSGDVRSLRHVKLVTPQWPPNNRPPECKPRVTPQVTLLWHINNNNNCLFKVVRDSTKATRQKLEK